MDKGSNLLSKTSMRGDERGRSQGSEIRGQEVLQVRIHRIRNTATKVHIPTQQQWSDEVPEKCNMARGKRKATAATGEDDKGQEKKIRGKASPSPSSPPPSLSSSTIQSVSLFFSTIGI
jgi:hypothetical protein